MTENRWVLIPSKRKEQEIDSKSKNQMLNLDDGLNEREATMNLWERKKRTFGAMENMTTSEKPSIIPLHSIPIKDAPSVKKYDLISKIPSNVKKSIMGGESVKDKMMLEAGGKMASLGSGFNDQQKIQAIESLEKFLYLDERFIEGDSVFNSGGQYSSFIKRVNSNFLIKSKTKFPDLLFNIFKSEEKEEISFCGLFPPLNLMYCVRNNIIYLWDYSLGHVYTYHEIASNVVNMHITLPKPGIFSPEVGYIIIVATMYEIFIILIIINEDKTLTLVKSDFLYDNSDYIITAIASTSERRVFLGSENNYLWELDYSTGYSFFSHAKKSKKIVHSKQGFLEKLIPNIFNLRTYSHFSKMVVDNTRHLLYAVTYYTKTESAIFDIDNAYDSMVTIYDLKEDGMGFAKIGEIKQSNIQERFELMSPNPNKRKETNFLILDVFPMTRKDYKNQHLVIVTKNGLRAYIGFDSYYSDITIPNETQILDIDKNKIYRNRPSMRYSITIRPFPEPSNSTIIEEVEGDNAMKALQRYLSYSQIYHINKKFFIYYKDDFKSRAYIDVIETEDTSAIRQELHLGTSVDNNPRNKEIISNILKFDIKKEINAVHKLPEKNLSSDFDLGNLLKRIDYENLLPRNINFLDSNDHCSYTCMHDFATQLFIAPEEFIVLTSSEVIYISKLRPIDNLYKILSDIESNQSDFLTFANEYGLFETAFMLFTIMCNKNFVFFRKHEESFSASESLLGSLNMSNIQIMDCVEIKNSEKMIDIATAQYFKLIETTFKGLNNLVSLDIKPRDDKKAGQSKVTENIIGQAVTDSQSRLMNYVSYSMGMYLARIARLFWEENLYYRIGDLNNNFIVESLKIHQIKYLSFLILAFQSKIKQHKDEILQKTSEIDIKMRNSSFNPANTTTYDFSNTPREFEQVLYLSERFLETLTFVELIFESMSLKRHLLKKPLNLFNDLMNIKFKDILKGNQHYLIKQLIEEYFEVVMSENDYLTVANKLDEMSQMCPSILGNNDKELITANLLIKLSKTQKNDEIAKKNMISKAIKLMAQNPENIKIEKMIKVLGELGEVRGIVEICVHKAVFLKSLLDKESDRITVSSADFTSGYIPTSSKSTYAFPLGDKENCFVEYKNCLYTILKLLNEIHMSIKYHDVNAKGKSTAPEYIQSVVRNKTTEELNAMRNDVIEEILKHDMKFLHDLLFDHLKSQDMLDDIIKFNSPYIYSYLNAQLEKEKTNPKRYESLYKFYLNSKSYEQALNILLQLYNFDNSQIIEASDKYVTLEDRRTYVKHLLYTIDLLIDSAGSDEEKKNVYKKIKNQMTNLRDTLLIQSDIFLYLRNGETNLSSSNAIRTDTAHKQLILIQDALSKLDRNIFTLEELYFNFSKKFKLYEINFQIYFEMCAKNLMNIPEEVKENYENYFKLIISRKTQEGDMAWPACIFPLLNKIFVTLIQSKTQYDSFFDMLRDNCYKNVMESVIPMEDIVTKIETLNWNFILSEKDIDFDLMSNSDYDTKGNPFWFSKYLKDVLQLPLFFIFFTYEQATANVDTHNHNKYLQLTLNMVHVIKLWCNNVNCYLNKSESRDTKFLRQIYDDYIQFKNRKDFLQNFLKEFYISLNESAIKMMLEDQSRERMLAFLKTVENKFHFIMNSVLKFQEPRQVEQKEGESRKVALQMESGIQKNLI